MRETPRSQRARAWAWLYGQLFETTEDDEGDTSGETHETTQRTTEETADNESG